MTRRTGLSWLGNLAVGLGWIGLVVLAGPASAAALAGTLDGSGTMHQQAWQTAYLMSEGSAESKVVGPLNRGARLEIDPSRSSDQYWFVKVPDSPGGNWQGFVWKDFVRVGQLGEAPAPPRAEASRAVAPMAASLAQREEPRMKSDKKKAAKPRVELETDPARGKQDSSMVAYDPELFEVSDASGVRATADTEAKPDAGPAARSTNTLVPPAAPPVAAQPGEPGGGGRDGASGASVGAGRSPASLSGSSASGDSATTSPVRQIQALRERIERELEAHPQTALSAGAAQSVDALVARLDEVLRIERGMLAFLESTSKMVETHDRHLQDLQQRVSVMAARGGPDKAGLTDEVSRLRKRLDELSSTVSTTRQHARRIDAVEAQLRRSAPVALEPGAGRIDPKHGSIAVDAGDVDHRAGELEHRLETSRKKATALARSIEDGSAPELAPDKIEIPHIDARISERLIQRQKNRRKTKRDAERLVEEGVIEIVARDPAVKPESETGSDSRDEARRTAPGSSAPMKSLEKGAGLQNGTMAAMLKKLRDLREERRRSREAREEEAPDDTAARGTAGQKPARKHAKTPALNRDQELEARAAAEPAEPDEGGQNGASKTSVGAGRSPASIPGSPASGEPVPDDMREDDQEPIPDTSKKSNSSQRDVASARRLDLGEIENLLSARL